MSLKLQISRNELLSAVSHLQSALDKKATNITASKFIVTATESGIQAYSTDLDVGISVRIDGEIYNKGIGAIHAKGFAEIVRELPTNSLVILEQKSNGWFDLSCDSIKMKILGLNLQESGIPLVPTEGATLRVFSKVFLEMLQKTNFAASQDASRLNLRGVYLEPLLNSNCRLVATDGHRLALIERKLFTPNSMSITGKGFLIPQRAVQELVKILDQTDELNLSPVRNELHAFNEKYHLTIKLLEHEYPDYRPVIPITQRTVVKVKRNHLLSAVKRVGIFTQDKSHAVRMTLDSNHLNLSSSNADLGEASEDISIQFNEPSIQLGFNSEYLGEFLPHVDSELIFIDLKDKFSPLKFYVEEDSGYAYYLMPMRV